MTFPFAFFASAAVTLIVSTLCALFFRRIPAVAALVWVFAAALTAAVTINWQGGFSPVTLFFDFTILTGQAMLGAIIGALPALLWLRRRAAINSDLAALQGTWEQVGVEVDGAANPSDEFSALGTRTVITGRHFQVRATDGALLLEGDFILDETARPKRVTWVDSMGADTGKLLPAIYELGADSFVFNAADEGAPWPSDFQTAKGQTMRRFVRIKSR